MTARSRDRTRPPAPGEAAPAAETGRSPRAALVALAVLVVIWAYSWIVMKQMMRYAGPFDFVALRFGIGAAVLFVVLVARRESLAPPPLALTIVVGICQTAAFQGLSQWALVSGGAGRVSLLAYTMPFWSVLLAWWLLDERPSRRQWLGIALAVAGLVAVIQPWHALGSWQSTALAITSGAFWALGTVLTKRMFQQYHVSPLAFTAWQMLVGAILLALVALWVPSPAIQWTPALIAGLLYAAVLASSLAWVLWSFIVERLSATVASLASLCVPMTAILMAWALLGERPDAIEGLGIALVVLGLLAISGIGKRRGRAPRHTTTGSGSRRMPKRS